MEILERRASGCGDGVKARGIAAGDGGCYGPSGAPIGTSAVRQQRPASSGYGLSAARLKLEQERLQLEQSKDGEHIQERFEKWVQQPEVKNRIFGPKPYPGRTRKAYERDFRSDF